LDPTVVTGLSFSALNAIMIYGIAVFLLTVVPVIVVFAYWIRYVVQSPIGGADVILEAIGKAFIYSLAILMACMVIVMLLIGISISEMNPAMGVIGFLGNDWITVDISSVGSTASPAYTDFQKEAAIFVVFILGIAKLIYHVLLIIFLIMIISFSAGLVKKTYNKSNSQSDIGFIGAMFASTVAAFMAFNVIIIFWETAYIAMLSMSDTFLKTAYVAKDKIDIKADLVYWFKIGLLSVSGKLGITL